MTEAGQSEAIILDRLEGIRLASSMPVAAAPSGISFRDLDVPSPDMLRTSLSEVLDEPFTFGKIAAIQKEIVAHYGNHDRPVVTVTVPEQDITEGVLTLIVTEARVGEVRTEGNVFFSDTLFSSQIPMRSGDTIYQSEIVKNIDRLNRNPFLYATAQYTPGDEPGETDIVIDVVDIFPWVAHVGYDDTGNVFTGEDRWFAGITWGNAFGLGHILGYEFRASFEIEQLQSHLFTYNAPLRNGHTLSAYAQTATSDVNFGGGFNIDGDGFQTGMEYTVPLEEIGPIEHEFFAGFQFKNYDNAILFGRPMIFSSETDIYQWLVGYRADATHHGGRTLFDTTLFFSPGNLNGNNSDAAFNGSRFGAESEYVYGTVGASRLQYLPREWSLFLRGRGQWSDGNLLASEQLPVGGYNSVRGYEYSLVRGDSGFVGSVELRTPPIFPRLPLHGNRTDSAVPDGKNPGTLDRGQALRVGEIQFLAFLDYGHAALADPLPNERGHIDLWGAGVGVRYHLRPTLQLRFDYGWQLDDDAIGDNMESRAHLGIRTRF